MVPATNYIPPLDRAFLSVNVACQVASCSRAVFYAAVRNGEIGIAKRGRRSLVPVPALKRWIASVGPRE